MSNYLNKTLERVAADLQSENGSAMRFWDKWRSAIASGDKSSWPRDAYEAQMQVIGELLKEVAKENTRMSDIGMILRDVIEKLRSELADYKNAAASEAERVNELTAENKTLREAHEKMQEEIARLKGETAPGKTSKGCRVCGLQLVDDLGRLVAMGYSCRRDDCPSRVIC